MYDKIDREKQFSFKAT